MLGGEVALSPHIDLTDPTSSHHSATGPDPSATEGPSHYAFANSVYTESRKLVNMVLNVHRNHKAYWGREEGGRGYGGAGRGRLYTYLYTVTTRMITALRWEAMRAILMFY